MKLNSNYKRLSENGSRYNNEMTEYMIYYVCSNTLESISNQLYNVVINFLIYI